MRLVDEGLFCQRAYVAGEWIDASNESIPVFDPATGDQVGLVPSLGKAATQLAIARAESARAAWGARPAAQRAALLLRIADLMLANTADLALIMTSEQGKPLEEAAAEVRYAASYFTWFAEEVRRARGDVIPSPWAGAQILVVREPIGVCGAITPWNFPLAMLARKCAPALAAGCAMVVKPSEFTPFSALALCVLAERAGLPAGILSCVTGDAAVIGGELASHPDVRKLSFTGSTRVGKLLMRQCADTVKRLSLELGGNAPFIVFDDANLDQAVHGLLVAKFRNAGQTCVSPNRILVHKSVQPEFVRRLSNAIPSLCVGDGRAEGTTIGPLINEQAVSKVERLVDSALKAGAQIVCGGRRHSAGPLFYEPTLITGVRPDMALGCEEIFGPVAAIATFQNDEEAIRMANDSTGGLASYFYSQDLERAFRVAAALDCGMVGVNEGMISTEVAPFGGRKESGFGREGSSYGLDDYTDKKYICLRTARNAA